MNSPQVCVPSRDALGESAIYDPRSGELMWLDLIAGSLFRRTDGGQVSAVVVRHEPPLGCLMLGDDPSFPILSAGAGIHRLDSDTGEAEPILTFDTREGFVSNDGKVDPKGDIWVTSLEKEEVEPRGAVFRIRGREVTLMESGLVCPNGPAFSADGATVYVSDSMARRILAYAYDGHRLTGRRVFASFGDDEGLPDGLAVDAQGSVWCAHYDAGLVSRFGPDGALTDRVRLPARHATSVAFGGPDLATLFVTTARDGLSEGQLASHPDSGSLFAIATGASGQPSPIAVRARCDGPTTDPSTSHSVEER